jgi:hypothetical protein
VLYAAVVVTVRAVVPSKAVAVRRPVAVTPRLILVPDEKERSAIHTLEICLTEKLVSVPLLAFMSKEYVPFPHTAIKDCPDNSGLSYLFPFIQIAIVPPPEPS